MKVTELGMEIDSSLLQSRHAYKPIVVTELGMVTEVRPLQPENAPEPM